MTHIKRAGLSLVELTFVLAAIALLSAGILDVLGFFFKPMLNASSQAALHQGGHEVEGLLAEGL